MSQRYVVAGSRPWNRTVFEDEIQGVIPGQWTFVSTPDELTLDVLERTDPRFVFFLHWSWKVPAEIHRHWECVVFHMTDLPYGRGGSPLQNLIVRGHRSTKLSAIRMVEELDAGPVYAKETLPLEGTAEAIYLEASRLSARMIAEIVQEEPVPVPQEGEPVIFRRRRPEESRLPELGSLGEVYDFIRMLDAEGYPRACILHEGFRFEFRGAACYRDRVEASVTISLQEGEEK